MVVIWDGRTGDVKKVLRGHSGEVNTVVMSNKGRFAITGAEDNTARVWDLSIPDTATDANDDSDEGQELIMDFHHGKILDIAYEEGDKYFITIAKDNLAMVWDLDSLKPIHILKGHISGLSWVFRIKNTNFSITASGIKLINILNI